MAGTLTHDAMPDAQTATVSVDEVLPDGRGGVG